ncbi:helix-turn-helix domain-containing protein [Streptomyces sp. H72]
MRWQLRLRAAERGVFRAVEMRRLLAAAGLPVSAGKMSALWSATVAPVSVRLDDLEVICRVLGCDAAGLLVLDPVPGTPAPAPVAAPLPGPVPVVPVAGETGEGWADHAGGVGVWGCGEGAGRPAGGVRPSLPPV